MPRTAQLLVFLALCCVLRFQAAAAESNAGSAEFAMLHPQWPCADARASENRHQLTQLRKAVVWNTFGTETGCLLQYMNDPRLVSLQIHLVNEVCLRHDQCGPYEFLSGMGGLEYTRKLISRDADLLAKLKSYLQAPSDFINSNLKPHTQCLISPGLESNLNIAAAEVLIETVRPFFPKCRLVWNPVGNSRAAKPIQGTIFELHGSRPELSPPCNADLDGDDINFPARPAIVTPTIDSAEVPSFIDRYKACENSFLWIAEFNGISGEEFIDPRERTAFPTLATFNRVNRLIAASQAPQRRRSDESNTF